jgi:glutamate/tyrosine decarboxylase-like PLP-dependent enzyme
MSGGIDPYKLMVDIMREENKFFYIHADMALYGPLYRFFHHDDRYFETVFPDCIDSFSFSGHKLFSIPDPCGIFISKYKK